MSMEPGKLPLTHFDWIRKLRPELWDYLERDVARLRQMGWQGSVASIHDYGSREYEPCITFLFEKFVRETAETYGLPVADVMTHFKRMPDAQLLLYALNHDYHSLLNFELAGRKTFSFSENLTDHLLATELDVDSELVRPPFDASLFVLPGRSAIDALYGWMRKQPDAADYRYPISVFVVSLADETNPAWRKMLMSISHWRGPQLMVNIKRELALRPGWNVDDALKTDWTALGGGDEEGGGFYLDHRGESREMEDDEFYRNGPALFRLVLNAVLYLGSNDPDIIERLSGREIALGEASAIKSHVKAKKARQEARKESELDYSSVGESIQPIYVTKGTPSGTDSPADGGFQEYAVRFVVRGHWRNQPCGTALTERRLTWIKPYYKGPEMAELVNRPYVVPGRRRRP